MKVRKMILTTLSILLLASLASCSSAPTKSLLNQASDYNVCWKISELSSSIEEGPRRALGAFGTIGMSEIIRKNNLEKLDIYLAEARSRNLGSCSSRDLAEIDCGAIYTDINNVDYKQCVLSTKRSIESRISADHATGAAREAKREAGHFRRMQLIKSMPYYQ